MGYLLRRLSREGLERGVSGGNWAWLVVAASAFILRRAMRQSATTTTIDVKSGETWVVSRVDPSRADS
jgi:hypothetical protein